MLLLSVAERPSSNSKGGADSRPKRACINSGFFLHDVIEVQMALLRARGVLHVAPGCLVACFEGRAMQTSETRVLSPSLVAMNSSPDVCSVGGPSSFFPVACFTHACRRHTTLSMSKSRKRRNHQ